MSKSRNIYNKKGTGTISGTGHRNIQINGEKRGEHRWIVEKVLGRRLKSPEEIHHVNVDPADNRHENLVVCPDRAYHKLLHTRTEALDACGHADWRKCWICKVWEPLDKLSGGRQLYHSECNNKYSLMTRSRRLHGTAPPP